MEEILTKAATVTKTMCDTLKIEEGNAKAVILQMVIQCLVQSQGQPESNGGLISAASRFQQ